MVFDSGAVLSDVFGVGKVFGGRKEGRVGESVKERERGTWNEKGEGNVNHVLRGRMRASMVALRVLNACVLNACASLFLPSPPLFDKITRFSPPPRL